MTIAEILENAKDQIKHMDGLVKTFDHDRTVYPLDSTRIAIETIDNALKENITQELTTRLYNLVNWAERELPFSNTILEVRDANETLKKVIQ